MHKLVGVAYIRFGMRSLADGDSFAWLHEEKESREIAVAGVVESAC